MNILLINYEYPPIGAGASNATYNMARSLLSLGHNPIVVTSAFEDWKDRSVEEGIIVYRLSAGRKHKDHSNIKQMAHFILACWWNLKKIAQKENVDYCIAFFTIPSGPLALYLYHKKKIPYIISLRGGDVPGTEPSLRKIHNFLKPLRNIIFKKARSIIANSKGLADLSEKSDPFPVAVVPNGVDCEFFSSKKYKDTPEPNINCLFVGRFQEQKNIINLLKQFTIASKINSGLHLKLVGNGPLKDELFILLEDLGIQNKIEWYDWQDKNSLSKLYKSADIFINPSLYEGMPNTVMEAMASGLPVIASDIFGNNDLVINNITGKLFSLQSIDQLSACIIELADSYLLRKKMGEAGRNRVKENFSWIKVTEEYLNFFKED